MDEVQTHEVTQVTTPATVPTTTVNPEHPQKAYQKKKTLFRIYNVIWYVLGIVEVLLLFRVVLKALGANAGSGFANLIYTLSAPLSAPFSGIFKSASTQSSVFEWSTIIACVVYALVAYGLVHLFQLIKPTTPQEVEQTVNNA